VTAVRERFPALATRAAYLDGPGGSQVPQAVLDAVAGYLRDSNANLGGAFPTSAASDEVMANGRAAAAEFTGGEPDGIAFGANMTTLNFQLAHAVARTLEAGDEIVVTQLDHDANVSPWLLVARDHGLAVRTAPIRTDDVTLDEDALEGLIGERTGSERSPGRTACTSPRIVACARVNGGSTCCSARPTSSSARTWG
jgi:selenocysteine lyase/cysteine desulfurase